MRISLFFTCNKNFNLIQEQKIKKARILFRIMSNFYDGGFFTQMLTGLVVNMIS